MVARASPPPWVRSSPAPTIRSSSEASQPHIARASFRDGAKSLEVLHLVAATMAACHTGSLVLEHEMQKRPLHTPP
eukprot:3195322-Prymnesium_polylepis.1